MMSNSNGLNETSYLKESKSRRYKTADVDASYENPGFAGDGHQEGSDVHHVSPRGIEDSLESSNKSAFGLRRQLGVSGATSLIFGCIVGKCITLAEALYSFRLRLQNENSDNPFERGETTFCCPTAPQSHFHLTTRGIP